MIVRTSWIAGLALALGSLAGTASAQPASDTCGGAIELLCNDLISSTTIGATAETPGVCSSVSGGTGGAVRYRINGTRDQFTLSACSGVTNLNTRARPSRECLGGGPAPRAFFQFDGEDARPDVPPCPAKTPG